ncbi:4-(cytidine 5'-diphospho)-2-C-methyl-D-erythritol kinase [Olivibacter sitiensis]|uniref:4-(cytidine 5'-diphospho)-2-C-methyl-D-erythritol kinase n=1 Tax=Olivibacter sitiensis TaxID=376470 RepID=UPI000426780E|nr:4-(cytidine 5'-diphospho)-2-C-methyl-D-erythritol kinase [Olivibacter sitiensis]
MIQFANAKINIGLQVLNRRNDGYHNLETVFYPLKIYDVLEILPSERLSMEVTGLDIPNNDDSNLCIKAFQLLSSDFKLEPVQIHLHKQIPIGAGLGGGSSDAAYMIKLLNEQFQLGLSIDQMQQYALRLGADCSFFIKNEPVFAEGIGNEFTPIQLNLDGYHIVLVKPVVHISTPEAYRLVKPQAKGRNLKEMIERPVEKWAQVIFNDFEEGIFKVYPSIRGIKAALYEAGALYASMSGSGSAVYGIFKEPVKLEALEKEHQVFYC